MNLHWRRISFGLLIAVTALAATVGHVLADDDSGFNKPGNYLIADQFNNRVIEVDRNGNIVWQFGLGPTDFSPASIIGTNDAQRVGELTLMAGTGTPGGSSKLRIAPIQPAAPTTACSWSTALDTSSGNTAPPESLATV